MIDIEDTLQQIQNNGPPDQVSLLLFQAMMFAATAYVDLQLVNQAGYSDRKTMRKVFFQKVRVRYAVNHLVREILNTDFFSYSMILIMNPISLSHCKLYYS